MKIELMTKTPAKWVERTDINEYAVRQAQSCDYLENLFGRILEKSENLFLRQNGPRRTTSAVIPAEAARCASATARRERSAGIQYPPSTTIGSRGYWVTRSSRVTTNEGW